MTTTFALVNQKGGVGKTTSSLALFDGLHIRGYKVLAIDLDPQKNFTFSSGANPLHSGSYDLLKAQTDIYSCIQHVGGRGDVISSSDSLSGADMWLKETGKEYRLSESLECLKGDYDFIIIDAPPSLGILTINALTASDYAIIPAQADAFSSMGIMDVSKTIDAVKRYCNPDLRIIGMLLTRFNARTTLSREVKDVMKETAQKLGSSIFTTTIREAIAVKESQYAQLSLFEYSPKAPVSLDYSNFINEVLNRING